MLNIWSQNSAIILAKTFVWSRQRQKAVEKYLTIKIQTIEKYKSRLILRITVKIHGIHRTHP